MNRGLQIFLHVCNNLLHCDLHRESRMKFICLLLPCSTNMAPAYSKPQRIALVYLKKRGEKRQQVKADPKQRCWVRPHLKQRSVHGLFHQLMQTMMEQDTPQGFVDSDRIGRGPVYMGLDYVVYGPRSVQKFHIHLICSPAMPRNEFQTHQTEKQI